MSVARVCGRVGMSSRSFYEEFSDREDCFLALFERIVAEASEVAREAYHGARAGIWRERLRAGLAALLRFLDDEPDLARLCIVDALGTGRRVLERRALVLDALAALVAEGRSEAPAGDRWEPNPSALTAEVVIGGAFSVIHTHLLDRDSAQRAGGEGTPPLINLLGPLMAILVAPYLGAAAAGEELTRPAPLPKQRTDTRRDPLEAVNTRLTGRSLRVLSAIAELGGLGFGPSNREVADAAGVSDQGQISKLLHRLEDLGLLENAGAGYAKRAPNAWRLTPRGHEIERTLHTHSDIRKAA
jgi:AcrR family transcriptional regulator